MAGRPYIPFLSQIEEIRGRGRRVDALELPDSEIVTPMVPLKVPPWGAYLNLPPASIAIVTTPEGERQPRERGGMLDLSAGEYGVQFVDLKRRSTSMQGVRARSKDAWWVSLTVEVVWRVSDVMEVADIHNPYRTLVNSCRAAIMNFIGTRLHDELVAAPDVSPMAEVEIAQGIMELLIANPALNGFQFIAVNVLERKGDPARTETIQEGRTDQLSVESHQVAARTQAELDAEIARILRPIEEQKVQIDRMQQEQALKQEQFLEILRVSGDVFRELAGVLSQAQMTPGLRHDLDNQAIELMLTGLDNLARSFSGGRSGEPPLGLESSSTKPNTPSPDPSNVLPAMDIDHLGESGHEQ